MCQVLEPYVSKNERSTEVPKSFTRELSSVQISVSLDTMKHSAFQQQVFLHEAARTVVLLA